MHASVDLGVYCDGMEHSLGADKCVKDMIAATRKADKVMSKVVARSRLDSDTDFKNR